MSAQVQKLQWQSKPTPVAGFADTIDADTIDVGASADTAEEPLGIVLGADSLAAQRSGIGRVTLEISRGLRRHAAIREFSFLLRGRIYPSASLWPELPENGDPEPVGDGASQAHSTTGRRIRAQLARIPTARKLYELKTRLELVRELQRLRERVGGRVVYHEPNFIARPFDGVTVVGVNDFSWRHMASHHPKDRLDWIDQNLDRTIRQASRFTALSEFTAEATISEFGVDRSRVDVVPLAPSQVFKPIAREAAIPTLEKYELQDGGFVLSVSTLEPRKNFDRLFAAHCALPKAIRDRYPLVIAGGIGWGRVLDSPAAERALRDGHLRLIGHVPDGELVALMARCGAFAYVSLYEGFGLPVIEAMASGAPVIASSTTAVGETAGSAAILVDPLNEQEISQSMLALLEDAATAQLYSEAGLARAAEYNWERTIGGLVSSWRKALQS